MARIISSRKKYVDATDTIQFVHKHEDGTITPGWQSDLETADYLL